MLVFPGGATYEPDARRYLFLQNFFSDLGATQTQRGQSNLFSMILFIVALLSVGASLIVAAPVWKRVIASRDKKGYFGDTAQLFAVLSGICYSGIAVTPWNLMLDIHMLFVQGAFTLLLAFVICLTAMQLRNTWPVRYIVSNVVYIAILTGYVFVLFHGPNLLTLHGLMFQVIAQKLDGESRFRSLQIGVSQESFGESIQRNLSWSGRDRPLPPEMRDDTAFHDRIHAYVPGWDFPKLNPNIHMTNHFGLVSDFLSECCSFEKRVAVLDLRSLALGRAERGE